MSNRVGFLKSSTERFMQSLRPQAYLKQPTFEDRFLKAGPQFKHSFQQLRHMHDLRLWTSTYAPLKKDCVARQTEMAHLNEEMYYLVANAMWKRILFMILFFFWTTRIRKDKYMKKYNTDTHDAHWRDTTGHN